MLLGFGVVRVVLECLILFLRNNRRILLFKEKIYKIVISVRIFIVFIFVYKLDNNL